MKLRNEIIKGTEWHNHPRFNKHRWIHSKCCGMHWELGWNINTARYELRCEKCGKTSGLEW